VAGFNRKRWIEEKQAEQNEAAAAAVEPGRAKLVLRQASRLGGYIRPWVARLTGLHPQYRFSREFLEATETVRGGAWTYYLPDGLFEYCDRNSKGAETRSFVRVRGGALEDFVSEAEIRAELAAAEPEAVRRLREAAAADQAVKPILADALEESGRLEEATAIRQWLTRKPQRISADYDRGEGECSECGHRGPRGEACPRCCGEGDYL
jgi:hypothetical protein